jgi:hypothetical protein
MWTHWGLNWFFFPHPIFAICLNFPQRNPSKNQYLPHLSSENCEIASTKPDFAKGFPITPRMPPNTCLKKKE